MEDLRKRLELQGGSCYDAARANDLGGEMNGAQERVEIRIKLPGTHSQAIRQLVEQSGLSQGEILARALEHGLPLVREVLDKMAPATGAS